MKKIAFFLIAFILNAGAILSMESDFDSESNYLIKKGGKYKCLACYYSTRYASNFHHHRGSKSHCANVGKPFKPKYGCRICNVYSRRPLERHFNTEVHAVRVLLLLKDLSSYEDSNSSDN